MEWLLIVIISVSNEHVQILADIRYPSKDQCVTAGRGLSQGQWGIRIGYECLQVPKQ